MKLPDGLFYAPRQGDLIKIGAPASIRIETGPRYPGNEGYQINDRNFKEHIAPYLQGDWADFDRLFGLQPPPSRNTSAVYSGAEHWGDPKKPNVTLVPNLAAKESRGIDRPLTVMGCTMGHFHPKTFSDGRAQEVYEFQSYGLLILDHGKGDLELRVARDGDKVAVPSGCHMTLYNLGDQDNPLVTLDFADPDRNLSNKDLARRYGPPLLIYYDDVEVFFVLNRLHINPPDPGIGVRLPASPADRSEREVRMPRGTRLDLGRFLYEGLTQDPDVIGRFARLRLEIQRATPEVDLNDASSSGLSISRPLVEAAKPNSGLYRYFFPNKPAASNRLPAARKEGRIFKEVSAIVEEKKKFIQLVPLGEKPLQVMVEGAGDWVTQAYRPIFEEINRSTHRLSVYYADDSRWREQPDWIKQLHSWEIHYDKANPKDFKIYQNHSSIDAVIIVTPDFTHSTIAAEWIGRAPLVFVEKPFDSNLENVDLLLQERGRRSGTTILGLDHFQAYALPLFELMPQVESHLGGALHEVLFYMTENRPIEQGRARTLQHGLTLDLLPHFLALLTYFGDVGTIDDIRVDEAGRYDPLIALDRERSIQEEISQSFRAETYSKVRFTFRDYSNQDDPVSCVAIVGKGFSQEVKYMEVTGRNGNAIRVDLNRTPTSNPAPDYPWDSVFFLQNGAAVFSGTAVRDLPDPYDPQRILRILFDPADPQRFSRPLERERYKRLINDLLDGTQSAVPSLLSMHEAPEIVWALDRIWRAVQKCRPWRKYDLDKTDPVRL
jgi:predicted dehydrogenase